MGIRVSVFSGVGDCEVIPDGFDGEAGGRTASEGESSEDGGESGTPTDSSESTGGISDSSASDKFRLTPSSFKRSICLFHSCLSDVFTN